MSLPKRIKDMRQDMGLTQAELADMLHVNRKIPSRWERGTQPQAATLQALTMLYDDFRDRPRVFARRRRTALE